MRPLWFLSWTVCFVKSTEDRGKCGEEQVLEKGAVDIKLVCILNAYAVLVCYFSTLLCT